MRFIILLALCFVSSSVCAQKARLGSLPQQSSYVVTNEVDALAMAELNGHVGPRLVLLESGTNGWNAAYAWGNHAGAGYLLSSVWNTWLSTNTYVRAEVDQTALAALAAFAATNKTKVVHSSVSSNVWATLGIGGTVTVHTVVSAQVPDPDNIVVDDPHDVFDGTYQNQGGGVYWFNADFSYIYISATAATLYTAGDTAAYGGDGTVPPFEFQEALNGFPLPVPTTSFALKAGYVTNSVPYVLTTGNVWQAVADVQQTADDALFAANQAATFFNYHTALDPNPHAGKFVTPMQLTNALSGQSSIIQPIRLASTNIVIAATNAVYALALTNAVNVSFDFSALSLGGTKHASATVYLDCLNTQALASVFNTNSVTFDMPWEPTVTGRYEIAVKSEGTRITASQAWPKNEIAAYAYTKMNQAGALVITPDLTVIAAGATNGAAATFVACPDCWYVVRAQFIGGNAGDLVTFGNFRNVYGYLEIVSPFVVRTIENPAAPYGFSSGWVIVPPPDVAFMRSPGFVNLCGVWVTRSSSVGDLKCVAIEVRKANALEIKAAQAMGL